MRDKNGLRKHNIAFGSDKALSERLFIVAQKVR